MAFTVDTNNLVSLGNAYLITGTYESHTTPATEAILPNSTIISFSVDRNLDDDDALMPRVHINSSDFVATVANGSVHHQDTTVGDTIAWTAVYK